MNNEKQHLIHSLLDAERDARREAILLASGRFLRRKRFWRVAQRSCAVAALIGIACLTMQRMPPSKTPRTVSLPTPPEQARSLTDEELLALFPNTPVALATLDSGKKRLLFLRPGDAERFIH